VKTWLTLVVLLAVAAAPTVIIQFAGKSCTFAGPVAWQRGMVVMACGNVYVCGPAGGKYASGVFALPATCSVDRIFAGGFDR
jgi:hypothetical protein